MNSDGIPQTIKDAMSEYCKYVKDIKEDYYENNDFDEHEDEFDTIC